MKNIYYFYKISAIGGVETFFYEIAKKYCDWDVVAYYDIADPYQLKRLQKHFRCIKRVKGEKVYCEKFFANFNVEMTKDVIAKEYYFVIHANFEEIGYHPTLDPKITHYIGVSQWTCDKFKEFTGHDAELCYNPISVEPKEKVMHLVSACRLDDRVKGGGRTLKLIEALDKYCESHGRHYLWTIFTNQVNYSIQSKNVALMKARVDVRPYIQDADWVLQLSNDMETYCYTLNEAWCYGVHTVSTPLSILKELPVCEGSNIVLDWDCANADEVARQIFEDERRPFNYQPPKDRWYEIFAPGENQYKEEMRTMIKVRALMNFEKIIDNEVGRTRKAGEEWLVSKVRLEQLQKFPMPLIQVVEEIKEEATLEKKAGQKIVRRKKAVQK